MSAFLFTGWTSEVDRTRGLVDSCRTLILHGCEEAQARTWFEGYLRRSGRAEDETPRQIEKIIVSPIVDAWFTESGDQLLDWKLLDEQAAQVLTAGEDAYEQQGYWADCNALVSPARLAPDLEALQRSLPEEVRSGLNWSADTQNCFLVSALVLPRAEPEPDYEDPELAGGEATGGTDGHEREAPFPELAEKEATGVVKARNTVVAAWLWRRYAAETRLASNPIRVEGWCSVVGPGGDAP